MHIRKGSDPGEYRVLNQAFPFRPGYVQKCEGGMKMLRVREAGRESSNTHYPWEDLNGPACVDVVLQG